MPKFETAKNFEKAKYFAHFYPAFFE